MRLHTRIRKLDDGRFKIAYYWHWWESTNREYLENEEKLIEFVSKLVKNTKWR